MNRLSHIDGLRAVAVLAVVTHHVIISPAPHESTWLSRAGQHGVDLFFVLSGFCLSYPILKVVDSSGFAVFDVAKFAARRLVRIIPPFFAAIALFLVAGGAMRMAGASLPPSLETPNASEIVRQALFLDKNVAFVNASFWTLPIEFRWYLFFPVALWLWIRSPRAFVGVIAAAYTASLTVASSTDLLVLPAFLAGVVAAHVHVKGHRFARLAFVSSVVVAVGATLFVRSQISSAWQVAAFLLVVAAGQSRTLVRILSIPLLAAVGAASYSIYLVHEPVIDFMVARGIAAPLAAVAAVAFGIAFWLVAERPFLRRTTRDRCVAELTDFLPRWLRVAGVDSTWVLAKPSNASLRVRRLDGGRTADSRDMARRGDDDPDYRRREVEASASG